MSGRPFASVQRIEPDSKVAVYHLHGQLNGHPDCFSWLDHVRRDIQDGQSRLVIHLGDITRVDSTGLGILAAIHVSASKAGGKVCLTGLRDRERLLFETTWLFKVIDTAPDEAEAIRACSAPA